MVTDRLALHDRTNPLAFEAAGLSVERACRQAGIMPGDVDLFELVGWLLDLCRALAGSSLPCPRGEGLAPGLGGQMDLNGLPAFTMGGQKARGNPLAAAGVYQLVEAAMQLRGEAGKPRSGARRALVQTWAARRPRP